VHFSGQPIQVTKRPDYPCKKTSHPIFVKKTALLIQVKNKAKFELLLAQHSSFVLTKKLLIILLLIGYKARQHHLVIERRKMTVSFRVIATFQKEK
jgi:hypothetical protein